MQIPERIGKYVVQSILGKGATGLVLRGFAAPHHNHPRVEMRGGNKGRAHMGDE